MRDSKDDWRLNVRIGDIVRHSATSVPDVHRYSRPHTPLFELLNLARWPRWTSWLKGRSGGYELREMSDHMLRDVGVSRLDAQRTSTSVYQGVDLDEPWRVF